VKDRDFTTQLPGDEIFDPEKEAEIQLEVDRLMRENPAFSIDEIRKNLGLSQEDLACRMRIPTEKVAELENLGINISVWDLLNVINCLGFNLDIYAEYEDEKMKLCFPPGKEIEK
jgi:ribosome-binding protein aMBF1 (putative translation factor)